MPVYKENMQKLFGIFRETSGKKKLPILLGELGSFNLNAAKQFKQINQIIWEYSSTDKHTAVIATGDLGHKGDNLHFNAAALVDAAKGYKANEADWFGGRWSGLNKPADPVTARRNVPTGIEHKLFEPAFYATTIADWGTSFACATELGPKAKCLVDLGHHAPNTNIEMMGGTIRALNTGASIALANAASTT